MDSRIREIARLYYADPCPETWRAYVNAMIRAGNVEQLPVDYEVDESPNSLDPPDPHEVLYRLQFDSPETREIIAHWNENNGVKISYDLHHYPLEKDSVIVWPGYRNTEHVFEEALRRNGIKWNYVSPKPYPPLGTYDYTQPPPNALRSNPRPRKMFKPKKRRASRPLTKIFGDPKVKEQYTHDELVELKTRLFYDEGRLVMFPEFDHGCKQCGEEDEHREWCATLFRQHGYRRNADSDLRDLERQSHDSSEAYDRWIYAMIRAGKREELLAHAEAQSIEDIKKLNEALEDKNYEAVDTGKYVRGVIDCPEPPPPNDFLNQIGYSQSEYYISELGSYGTTHSELAMHAGLAGIDIDRYLLMSSTDSQSTGATVTFYRDGKDNTARGSASEVLSHEIRDAVGNQLPLPGEKHHPMISYSTTIVARGDGIYRAEISFFYYPRHTYWRLNAGPWDYKAIEAVVSAVFPHYKESYSEI